MLKRKTSKSWAGFCLMLPLFIGLFFGLAPARNYDVTPVINNEATRGLSSISSAEAVGEGRLTFNVTGNWYKQNQAFALTPNKNANILNGLGAVSYGASPQIDLFASVGAFGSSNYNNTPKEGGWGSVKAGVQGTLPYPEDAKMRLGAQLALIGGTADNQINGNRADGFNYFQTRTGTDFMAKIMQSLVIGSESHSIKLHLNEGAVTTISGGNSPLLLLGAGLQGNLFSFAAVGLELNSRTKLNDWAFRTDPVWVTPSVQFRSSFNTNITAGVDVAISNARGNGEPRALEPYRVFGAVAFSFDMMAKRRFAEAQEKKRAANIEQENIDLIMNRDSVQIKTDSLAMKAHADSVAHDAVTKENINLIQDQASIMEQVEGLNQKSLADSLTLAQAESDLAAEKDKRSDAEKMLLSTGEMLLDAVYFESGKTILTLNSKPYLNIISKMLLKYPKLQFEVAGYTDNVGGKEYNIKLSQGRAQAVIDYLVEAAPALSANLSARGYGMSLPRADNNTEEGRQANRRVELRVLNKSALQEYGQL